MKLAAYFRGVAQIAQQSEENCFLEPFDLVKTLLPYGLDRLHFPEDVTVLLKEIDRIMEGLTWVDRIFRYPGLPRQTIGRLVSNAFHGRREGNVSFITEPRSNPGSILNRASRDLVKRELRKMGFSVTNAGERTFRVRW